MAITLDDFAEQHGLSMKSPAKAVAVIEPNQNAMTFNFEGAEIRSVKIGGATYFCGIDVAKQLGYSNPHQAVASHCKGLQQLAPLQTKGGRQNLRVIEEPDVLRLIVGSTLPVAERFQRWVFKEVLPSIRKTGSYSAIPAPAPAVNLNDPATLRTLLLATTERELPQLAVIGELSPKAAALDHISARREAAVEMTS